MIGRTCLALAGVARGIRYGFLSSGICGKSKPQNCDGYRNSPGKRKTWRSQDLEIRARHGRTTRIVFFITKTSEVCASPAADLDGVLESGDDARLQRSGWIGECEVSVVAVLVRR